MVKGLVLAVTFATCLLVSLPGLGNEHGCTARADVIDHLNERYSESPVAMGMTNGGAVLEILTSKNGETWTIIITLPNGESCVISSGRWWDMPLPSNFGPRA